MVRAHANCTNHITFKEKVTMKKLALYATLALLLGSAAVVGHFDGPPPTCDMLTCPK